MRAAYIGSKIKYADLAQLVEHILGKDEVTSSNLVISSKTKPHGHQIMGLFGVYRVSRPLRRR